MATEDQRCRSSIRGYIYLGIEKFFAIHLEAFGTFHEGGIAGKPRDPETVTL